MANRIDEKFRQLKRENRGGFIPFIVAGDPNLETTKDLLIEFSRLGASVIELGVPFTDPVADGATIQRAAMRALQNPIDLPGIFQTVAEFRTKCETPLILFSYFNPIMQFGLRKFAGEAKNAGVDGVLITDLIPEEADEFKEILAEENLHLIMLAAPTSSDERLRKITEKAGGFVYAIARAGVTGAKTNLSDDAEILVQRLRKFTDLPVAVGFGISTAGQVKEVLRYADAAVVGSAIVAEIERLRETQNIAEKIGSYVAKMLE
jgi:tryptophan synthase alpha chain